MSAALTKAQPTRPAVKTKPANASAGLPTSSTATLHAEDIPPPPRRSDWAAQRGRAPFQRNSRQAERDQCRPGSSGTRLRSSATAPAIRSMSVFTSCPPVSPPDGPPVGIQPPTARRSSSFSAACRNARQYSGRMPHRTVSLPMRSDRTSPRSSGSGSCADRNVSFRTWASAGRRSGVWRNSSSATSATVTGPDLGVDDFALGKCSCTAAVETPTEKIPAAHEACSSTSPA